MCKHGAKEYCESYLQDSIKIISKVATLGSCLGLCSSNEHLLSLCSTLIVCLWQKDSVESNTLYAFTLFNHRYLTSRNPYGLISKAIAGQLAHCSTVGRKDPRLSCSHSLRTRPPVPCPFWPWLLFTAWFTGDC